MTSQVEARANFVTGFREDRRITPQRMPGSMSRTGTDRCFEDSSFRSAIEDERFEGRLNDQSFEATAIGAGSRTGV